MSAIHITDLEAAIDPWRAGKRSPGGPTIAPQWRAPAQPYALRMLQARPGSFPPAGRRPEKSPA